MWISEYSMNRHLLPMKAISAHFGYEPSDSKTVSLIREFLALNFSEVDWKVRLTTEGISINAIFASESEKSFYTLKWA